MKLFISYSRDDKAWVYELHRAIQDEGQHDAWIDRRIVPASDWWETILENVEACVRFIYIMTPKSVDSIYCQAELEYALALNKPVLPLMLKSCENPESLSQRRIQYLTISDDMNLDRVLLKIEQGLNRVGIGLIQGKFEPKSAPRPDVPKPKPKHPEHAYEIYAMAAEAAAGNNISLAEQLFQQVITADPHGLGLAATERLTEIRFERNRNIAYQSIVQLDVNPMLKKDAAAAWRSYVHQYGTDYDPNKLAQRISGYQSSPIAPQKETIRPPTTPTKPSFKLPDPFAWIDIPTGRVEIDGQRMFDVPAFAIAKYPITVAQYEAFIKAYGYNQRRYWTNEGWQWKEQNKLAVPRYWYDEQYRNFFKPDHPIIGISWYEAMAFCQWLSEQIGHKISLPTEQQWQWAAQGNDGRTYPWGNKWDCQRCNNSVQPCSSRQTTSVRQYEGKNKGDCPFDVVDMVGNVWEWCLTELDTGSEISSNIVRVLRRV